MLVPAHAMNRSVKYWGADAKEFKPERWLIPDGILKAAQDIQGHRHLLTFADGPRICLGRHFALAEFKVSRCDSAGSLMLTFAGRQSSSCSSRASGSS